MEIDKFNQTIEIWIAELPRFDIHQLVRKPDAKSWSLGQVYEHLIEETSWYNGQIEISIQTMENAEKETSHEARILFDRGSFEDKSIQGDPLISENVKQPQSVEQLKLDMEKLKEDTNKLFIRMQCCSSFGKSEHPGLGFLNCFEWINYSEMHMRHHLKQKRRIEEFLNL